MMSSQLPYLPLHLSRSPLLSETYEISESNYSLVAKRSLLFLDKSTYSTSNPAATASIPPRPLISLLNLLDVLDAEVTSELARLSDHLKEAHVLIEAYKAERAERRERIQQKLTHEQQQTKNIGSDFWLGI